MFEVHVIHLPVAQGIWYCDMRPADLSTAVTCQEWNFRRRVPLVVIVAALMLSPPDIQKRKYSEAMRKLGLGVSRCRHCPVIMLRKQKQEYLYIKRENDRDRLCKAFKKVARAAGAAVGLAFEGSACWKRGK